MMKKLLAAAMLGFAACVAALVLIAGGCADKKRDAGKAVAGQLEIGRDPARMARLEKAVVVEATVFNADGARPFRSEAALLPGTWLLPCTVFSNPACEPEGDVHDR